MLKDQKLEKAPEESLFVLGIYTNIKTKVAFGIGKVSKQETLWENLFIIILQVLQIKDGGTLVRACSSVFSVTWK